VGKEKKDDSLPKVILKGSVLVDRRLLKANEVRKRYGVSFFDERSCASCENLIYRPNDMCHTCPSFEGTYNLADKKTVKGQHYYVLPLGDIANIRRRVKESGLKFQVVNKQKPIPFTNPLKWTGKLYGPNDVDSEGKPRPDQEHLVAEWLAKKMGVIKARARSGKSLLAIYCAMSLGVKTTIVAHEHQLLVQFKKIVDEMTNALKFETPKTPVSVIIEKMSDFDSHPDIALITYQKFIRKTGRAQQYINDNYSFLVVDEMHQSAADAYTNFIGRLNMPFRLGLSATNRRKDGRERLAHLLLGPVVVESDTYTLMPSVTTHLTKTLPPYEFSSWPQALKWAATDLDRHKEIVRQVFVDLRNGHNQIIIPVPQRAMQAALQQLIDKQVLITNRKHGEEWPADLAVILNRQTDRTRVLERVDNGSPCVLIAITSMIKQGIDMKLPTKLHVVIPMSAKTGVGAPMFEQLSYRVCTPHAGKKQPEVTVWIDQCKPFQGSLRGLFWQEIVKGLKAKKYLVPLETFTAFKGMNAGRGVPLNSKGKPNVPRW
jgi:superfamily II DNA or RNA helicase